MHKQRVIKLSIQLILLTSVTGLAGCSLFSGKDSYFRDYSVDYAKAKETKPLEIPADLSSDSVQPVMPVPAVQISQGSVKSNVIPAPRDTVMQAGNLTYQLKSMPAGTVIESDASRELLWVRIQAFLKAGTIAVANKSAQTGTVETEWFTPKGQIEHGVIYRSYVAIFNKTQDEDQQLKLRFSLKPSSDKGEWVIAIQAQKKPVGSTKPVVWSTASDSILLTGVKADFLVYLVEHSGDQVVEGSTGEFNPKTISMLKDGNGNPVLKISSSFDTAWNAVEKALKKGHVSVEKANHAAGIFYIALPGAEDAKSEDANTPGFFAKLFGDGKSETIKQAPVYRVILSPVNDGIYVSLEKDVDTIAPEKLSEVVLQKIKLDL